MTTATNTMTRSSASAAQPNSAAGLDNVKGVPKWEEWLALWKVWDQCVAFHPLRGSLRLTNCEQYHPRYDPSRHAPSEAYRSATHLSILHWAHVSPGGHVSVVPTVEPIHSPTFLDIHLTRMAKGSHTEPEHFKDIFERGIDPDVDDPTKIHVNLFSLFDAVLADARSHIPKSPSNRKTGLLSKRS